MAYPGYPPRAAVAGAAVRDVPAVAVEAPAEGANAAVRTTKSFLCVERATKPTSSPLSSKNFTYVHSCWKFKWMCCMILVGSSRLKQTLQLMIHVCVI